MKDVVMVILTIIYNLTLIGGCAYLVVKHGWSPWWFALVVFLFASYSSKS